MQRVVDVWYKHRGPVILKYGDISEWNASLVTNMKGLFKDKIDFDDDISKWNVSNVTNTGNMFYKSLSFNGNVSGWKVSNVTNMSGLGLGCRLILFIFLFFLRIVKLFLYSLH